MAISTTGPYRFAAFIAGIALLVIGTCAGVDVVAGKLLMRVDRLMASTGAWEVRQLHRSDGKVLIFGDSHVRWRAPGEPRDSQLFRLLGEELSQEVIAVHHSSNDQESMAAYTALLEREERKPALVILPIHIWSSNEASKAYQREFFAPRQFAISQGMPLTTRICGFLGIFAPKPREVILKRKVNSFSGKTINLRTFFALGSEMDLSIEERLMLRGTVPIDETELISLQESVKRLERMGIPTQVYLNPLDLEWFAQPGREELRKDLESNLTLVRSALEALPCPSRDFSELLEAKDFAPDRHCLLVGRKKLAEAIAATLEEEYPQLCLENKRR